jgi:hypothetical protein
LTTTGLAVDDELHIRRDNEVVNWKLDTDANTNTMSNELTVSRPTSGDPYTVTFESDVVDYDPNDLDTRYTFYASSDTQVKVVIEEDGTTGKDIGLRFKDTSGQTEAPAKINALKVNLGDTSECQSAQIIDSEIEGNLTIAKLKHHASGPSDAGRCQIIAAGVPGVGELDCHNYQLEAAFFNLTTLTCSGELTGFIKTTVDSEETSDVNIVVEDDVSGTIDIYELEGNITADNFLNGSILRFKFMSGDITANGTPGDLAGTIECVDPGTQFSGDISVDGDIATTALIKIDGFIGPGAGLPEPKISVGNDIKTSSEIRIKKSTGDIIALGDVLGKLLLGEPSPSLNAMDGNLAGDNLDVATCVFDSGILTANSAIFWGPYGRINDGEVDGGLADTSPNDRAQDACDLIMGCVPGTDSDCDGVDNDGDSSGEQDDNPCNSGTANPTGCDDNCLNTTNNGSSPTDPVDDRYPFQTDVDGDGIGDACDNCANVYNVQQLDCDEDRTGDACDVKKGFYDADADRDPSGVPDGDVDGVDFAAFAACYNGAGKPPRTLGCPPGNVEGFDFDRDGDIDGVDFSVFAACFNKAGKPPRSLGCPAAKSCRSDHCQ